MSALKENKDEIIYNIINSMLAGALVFLGSLTQGFSMTGILVAFIAAGVICLTKFNEYWATQKGEYSHITKGLFNFI